jgi:hypothetical protein
MARSINPIAILACILFFSDLAQANTRSSPEPGNCSIIGDGDLYGPGIRISFYFQWAAVIIATWIASQETHNARTTVIVITIAIFANTFRRAANNGLVPVKWWIVMFNTFFLQIGNVPFSWTLIAWSASSLGTMMILWSVILLANCWV